MYAMSDGPMARLLPHSQVQPFNRPGYQSSQSGGNELNLLTNLTPDYLVAPHSRAILTNMGLDAHWLICMIVHHIPSLEVDLTLPRELRDRQLCATLDMLGDTLYNDLVAANEAEGFDDGQLMELDSYIEENVPTLMGSVEFILSELFNVIANYDPPAWCLHRTLVNYLIGYSTETNGQWCGILHFHFSDQ